MELGPRKILAGENMRIGDIIKTDSWQGGQSLIVERTTEKHVVVKQDGVEVKYHRRVGSEGGVKKSGKQEQWSQVLTSACRPIHN
jgi:hypothetical protein